jgi:Cu-Zn family superoxide dismutase
MVDTSHGMPDDPISQRHVGDLGNVETNADGRTWVALVDHVISLGDDKTRNVINLPLMIHNLTDDGGHTGKGESNATG